MDLLLADGPAQGDHRGGAEQTDLDTRRGEARLLGGDNEVAGGGELATCGGGDAVDLRYDGLRYPLNGLHQLAADVEEVTVESGVPPYHLREVVARAEGGTLAAQYDHRSLPALSYLLEAERSTPACGRVRGRCACSDGSSSRKRQRRPARRVCARRSSRLRSWRLLRIGFRYQAWSRVSACGEWIDRVRLSFVLALRSISPALEEVDDGCGRQKRRNENQEEAKGTARKRGPDAGVDQGPPPEQAHQEQERRAA